MGNSFSTLLSIFAAATLSLQTAQATPAAEGVASKHQIGGNILFINSYNSAYKWSNQLVAGFRAYFHKHNSLPVSIDVIELNASPTVQKSTVESLIEQLAIKKYDLIVTADNPATELFLDGKIQRDSSLPLIFAGYARRNSENAQKMQPNTTGLYENDNIERMLEIGTKLFPSVKCAAIITSGDSSGKAIEQRVRRQLTGRNHLPEIVLLNGNDHSTEDVLKALDAMPLESFVIYNHWASHRDKLPPPESEALRRILKHSHGPVFGNLPTAPVPGLLGGMVVTAFQHGLNTGKLAAMVLTGIQADSIPPRDDVSQSIFDWSVMKNHQVEANNLPLDTIFINRPHSRLYQYRHEIASVSIAVTSLLGATLILVLAELFRSRRYKMIFSALPLRVAVSDTRGKLHFLQLDKERRKTYPPHTTSVSQLPDDIRQLFTPAINAALNGKATKLEYRSGKCWRRAEFMPLRHGPFHRRLALWYSLDITELSNARSRLSTLAERFEMTLRSIGDGVVVTNAHGIVTLVNQVTEAMTGLAEREMTGKPVAEVLKLANCITGEKVMIPTLAAIAREKATSLPPNTALLGSDGSRRHIADSAAPIHDADGNLSGAVMVFRDITAEYEHRRRITRQNVFWQSAAEIAGISYFITSPDLKATQVMADENFWPRRDNVPVPPEEWMNQDDAAKFHSLWNEFVTRRQSEIRLSYSVPLKNGDRSFEMRTKMFSSGESAEVIGIIRETTRETENLRRTQDLYSQLQLLLDNIPVYVSAKDIDDDFRYAICNRRCEKLFNLSTDRIIGNTDADMLPLTLETAKVLRLDREAAASNAPTETIDDFTTFDKKVHRGRFFRKAIKLATGRRLLFTLLVDITNDEQYKKALLESREKLSRALDDAKRAERAKSMFLATMSHEIRTPLNAVIGFSELLQTPNLTVSDHREYLTAINHAGQTLLSLINDVLDLSKMEAGQLKFSPEPTDIAETCNEIIPIFKFKLSEKKIYLRLETPPNPPKLKLDKLRLRQIMLNLLGNAVKFTQVGGITVKIAVSPIQNGKANLTIAVADTGVGISSEMTSRIFDPFIQADNQIRGSRAMAGTGLGLPIIQRLVRNMGGEITVESEVGKGSCFTISLPGLEVSQEKSVVSTATGDTPAATTCPTGNFRVLLVDDVPVNLAMLKAMMVNFGIAAETADSGGDALKKLHSGAGFDAVFTDMWMPGMNGVELAKAIRSNTALAKLKLVAVTADTEAATDFDMNVFDAELLKPVTMAKLAEMLKKIRG